MLAKSIWLGVVLWCLLAFNPSAYASSLAASRSYWEQNAPTCDGYPAKDRCVDGDMVLFGGMLCAAGEHRGCDLVRAAQGGDGQWWRSPRRNPGNLGEAPSFSRDMALGVLLYLATTRDQAAAERWLDWIDHNRPCVVEKPFGGGCLVRGLHRYCRDEKAQTCTLTPGNWGLMARVWQALGLPLSKEMRDAEGIDADALPAQAAVSPVGYELHLPGAEVLLKMRLGDDSHQLHDAAAILAARQPQNLFFAYLHAGKSEALRTELVRLCPDRNGAIWSEHDQWSWERDTESRAWTSSMGWDCLFMADLLD